MGEAVEEGHLRTEVAAAAVVGGCQHSVAEARDEHSEVVEVVLLRWAPSGAMVEEGQQVRDGNRWHGAVEGEGRHHGWE